MRSGPEDSTRSGQRIPPHDLDAERALLGSMLLSADAIRAGAGLLSSDFYVPIHGRIYDAIMGLFLDDEGVDVVTVAHRVGAQLEKAGGKELLIELAMGTPASANAKTYRELVERTARARQLIAAVGEVAEVAYSGSTDWHQAAARVTDVANRNGVVVNPSSLDIVDLGPILRGELPPIEPFWLRRSDGRGLLYPGRVHDFHAEPNHGKTWLALVAVIEVRLADGAVFYLDIEDSAQGILERLFALGCPPELIEPAADRFRYIRPDGPLRDVELAQLDGLVEELNPDLVILDGVAEALSRDGYDENSNSEVVAWGQRVPRHFADLGPAVLMLDHLTKDPKGRSRGARGAGAKLGLINGASFELRCPKPFSRRRRGLIKVIVAKDRHGGTGSIGETVAECPVEPRDDGAQVAIRVELPTATGRDGFKPTGLMEKVSDHLRHAGAPHTERNIFDAVRGKREHVRHAIELLVEDGFVEKAYTGGVLHYGHVKRYQEHPPEDPPGGDIPMAQDPLL